MTLLVLPPDTSVSLFVNQKGDFNAGKRILKRRAFMPRMDHRAGCMALSTCRSDGRTEPEMWAYAVEHVENPNRPIKARGDLTVQDYRDFDLKDDFDDDPPGHVNIVGWPDEKHDIMDICNRLAAHFAEVGTFFMRPDGDASSKK